MIDINWVRENPREAKEKIEALMEAIEPFAEAPTDAMNNYACHVDINTKERCGRCSRAIAAWNALTL